MSMGNQHCPDAAMTSPFDIIGISDFEVSDGPPALARFDVTFASGMTIRKCRLLRLNGQLAVHGPTMPNFDPSTRTIRRHESGRAMQIPMLAWRSAEEHAAFSRAVLAALADRHLWRAT